MKALNILVLTLRIPYPPLDGGAIAMYGTLKTLKKLGNTTSLVALNTSKHFQPPSVIGQEFETYVTELDTSVKLIPALLNYCFGAVAYNIIRFNSPKHHQLIEQILKQRHFDVIQLEGIYLALYLKTIRNFSKAPVVLRAHNIEFEIWKRLAQKEGNIIKRYYFSHLARKGEKFEIEQCSQFDGIVSISDKDLIFFKEHAKNTPCVSIPSGIDLPNIEENLKNKELEKEWNIGFLASLEWIPNIQGLKWFVKEVFPLILNRVNLVKLNIAGRGMPSWMQKQWGHNTNIQLFGEVKEAEHFIRQQSVIIVPLLSGSGIRIKILESMAYEKCIITTTIGVEGITAQNGQNILIADSAEFFAEKTVQALSNKDFRQSIATHAYQFVQKSYNWENIGLKFMNFYSQVTRS